MRNLCRAVTHQLVSRGKIARWVTRRSTGGGVFKISGSRRYPPYTAAVLEEEVA